ncbi:MAG: hypothetical protein VYD19_08825 [Myxococcota bacterium]|nr:hypothetical protein [Myxococcota bacterium]
MKSSSTEKRGQQTSLIAWIKYFTPGVALSLISAACADSIAAGGGGAGYDMMVNAVGGSAGQPPIGGQGGFSGAGGAGGAVPGSGSRLQIQGEMQATVELGSSLLLQVRLFSPEGGVVPGARISFELLDQNQRPLSPDPSGAILAARFAQTDTGGLATMEFVAGNQPATYLIRAVDDPATTAPVSWRVSTAQAGNGSLSLRVTYDTQRGRFGYVNLERAAVSLFQGFDCQQLLGGGRLPPAYLQLPEIQPFNEVNNSTSAPSLPAGERFSALATIYGTSGAPVAFGCAQGIQIDGGRPLEVEIPCVDKALTFKGVYTGIHRFDLINALQESGDGTLERVGDIFEVMRVLGGEPGDRGAALTRFVCELTDLGNGTCGLISGLLGGAVDEIFVQNVIPENVQEVLRVAGDVLEIVGDMNIVGQIEFPAEPNASQVIVGSENRWQLMRFRWRRNCPPNEACEREFTFGDLEENPRPVRGIFDTDVSAERAVIRPHGLEINYGTILLGVLENWIIPAVVDGAEPPLPLSTLLDLFIDCSAINMRLNLSSNSTLCEDVLIRGLGNVVEGQLLRLNFSADDLEMSGHFQPIDRDGDGSVDQLLEGTWSGTLMGNGLTFPGCFTACRGEDPCELPECMIP